MAGTAPRVPIYSASRAVPKAFAGKGAQDGVQEPILQFDLTKAFWVQNMVSNFCYFRWRDMYPVVRKKIDEIQKDFRQKINIVDQRALQIYQEKGEEEAIKYLTLFSVNVGNKLHDIWFQFYGELFVTYRDFYNIVPKTDAPGCGCEAIEPGLSPETQQRIIRETKDHYKVKGDAKDHPDTLASSQRAKVF